MILPIIIPAKNEENSIGLTIKSIKENVKNSNIEPYIVVIDDGSKDNTYSVALSAGASHVIKLPDRGYSALGRPELANTFNAGFEYIDKKINKFKYLMICGADTILYDNYIEILLNEMEKDDKLVICAGNPIGYKTNSDSVRGAGRIIRSDFWSLIGRKYPNKFYSWESYPIVYAQAHGYKTKTINHAIFGDSREREPLSLVDWKNYGIGMREKGSLPIYVIARALKRLIVHRDFKAFYRLLYGYFFINSKNKYENELIKYTRTKELKKILKFGI